MTEHEEQRTAAAAPAALAAKAPPSRRAAAVRILPFAAYILFTILGDLAERSGISAADLRWLYPIKIGAVALLLALFWREYTELRDTGPGPIVTLVAIAAGVAVLGLWISLDAGWMVVGSSPGFDPRTGGQIDWTLALVRIAGAALVVPVMEELFWRSFLMRWIEAANFRAVDPSQVGLKSFVITVVLFGFEHNLWLAGIVAGVVYSVLYLRYRTLWSPVLAHAVTNGLLGIWVVATANWWYW